MKHIHSDALLPDIRRVADSLGRTPTSDEYDELGAYSTHTIRDRFGSWNEALVEAGLEPNRQYGTSRRELLDDLRRVADELERTPTRAEYNDRGRFSVGALRYRFDSWRAAVEAADLDPRRHGDSLSPMSLLLERLDPDQVPAGGDR